jgi:hypothetical protein
MNRDLNHRDNIKKEQEKIDIDKIKTESNKMVFKIDRASAEENSSFEDYTPEMSVNSDESESRNRISAFSKVNFTKLSAAEKEDRLKNLAKLVKRLRRKVRNLEKKFKQNASKTFNKYVTHSIVLNTKKTEPNTKNKEGANIKNKINLTIEKLCKALNNLRNYESHEYEDQKFILENLINLIADDRLSLDSIHFKKICTQVRLLLEEEKIRHTSSEEQKVVFSFPEKDVCITSKEYELYSQFKDKEDVMRAILGIQAGLFKKQPHPQKINFSFSNNINSINNSPNSQNIKLEKIEGINCLNNNQGNSVSSKCNIDNNILLNNITNKSISNVHTLTNNYDILNKILNQNINPQQNQSFLMSQLMNLNNNLNLSNLSNLNNPYAIPLTNNFNNISVPQAPLFNPVLVQYLQNIVNNNNINQNSK